MSEIVVDDLNLIKAKGNDFFVKGDFFNAEQTYTQALEMFDQNNVLLLTNRSAARLGLDNYIGALEDADKAVSLDPKWTKAYFRKATALEKLNRPKEAYETWIDATAHCEPSAW
jgi:serine/threonine-protein phosphatase 5